MTPPTERARFDARHGVTDERSIGEIAGDLIGHSQQLLRGEIALAKREVQDGVKQVGIAAGIGVAAWPFALGAIVLLGVSVGFALAELMPLWAGFLVAAAIYVIVAAALALVAKARVKDAQLAPTQTLDSAKEDLTWIKQHRN
jgi:hypothetical protein